MKSATMPKSRLEAYSDGVFAIVATLLVALAFAVIRWHASFRARLMDPGLGRDLLVRGMRRGLVGPLLYVLGMAVAPFAGVAAWVLFLAVPVVCAVPVRAERRVAPGAPENPA